MKNNICKIREEKKVTIRKLAVQTKISERHLRFIETGDRCPSLKNALIIAGKLGVRVEDIFFLDKCTISTHEGEDYTD